MKFVIIFVIVSVFLDDVLGTTIIQPLCTHLNETYQKCSNGCDFTCDNYATAGACPDVCRTELAGCYCDPGLVRNSNRDCVLPEHCPEGSSSSPTPAPEPITIKPVVEPQPPCCEGEHETFICGTLCPLTCATKNRMYKCSAGCQLGCFCDKGYLRNSKNKCVPRANCD